MQKPIMIKHILLITICLLGLLTASPAEARLTLGAVVSDDATPGTVTSAQARALADSIAEQLGDEVVVKELADSASLIRWLDRFAALDLALISPQDVVSYSGRFLMIGQLDEHGSLNLVARQGVSAEIPVRVAEIVRASGFSPWRSSAQPAIEPEPAAEIAPSEAIVEDESITQAGQEASSDAALAPEEKVVLQKLVLGVVPDSDGLLSDVEQAALLVAYLEQNLPVSITIKEFATVESFAQWFMRYRMVDIAVLPSMVAQAHLGRDYRPIVKLMRGDKPGDESAELVVMRRGQNQALQGQVQQSLLGLTEGPDGRELMATLSLSDVLEPKEMTERVVVEVEVVEPSRPVEDEPAAVAVEETTPVHDYPVPTEPVAPPAIEPESLPELTQVLPEKAPVPPEIPAPVADLPVLEEQVAAPVTEQTQDEIADLLLKEEEPDYPVPTQPVAPPVTVRIDVPEVSQKAPPLPAPPEPELPNVDFALPVAGSAPEAPLFPASPPTPKVPVLEPAVSPEVVAAPPALPTLPAIPAASPPGKLDPETVAESPPVLPVSKKPVGPVVVTSPVQPPLPDVADIAESETELPGQQDDQAIIEEVLKFADPMTHESAGEVVVLPGSQEEATLDGDAISLLGDAPVVAMVAQPDIPQQLRPPGVPVVRPGRVSSPERLESRPDPIDEEVLVASIPKPRRPVVAPRPPKLLPEEEPEPGVIYVVPFVSIMVPLDVSELVFDQFVDLMNEDGEKLGLEFVILKEGLQRVSPEWLEVRKYITGEVYAYVEDRGATATDLRSKARLTYRRPEQSKPAFGYEYPVRKFFDNDQSTVEEERVKMAEEIATTLASELMKALQN